MVAHPRTAACANRLRPLNQPQPIKVQEDKNGDPIAIIYTTAIAHPYTNKRVKERRVDVEGIKDRWRIDDEWWRKEISRLYYQVVLQDGRILTLFHDLLDGGWFTQSVTPPTSRQDKLHVFVGPEARIDHSIPAKRHYASQ